MSTAATIKAASDTLMQAIAEDHPALVLSTQATLWILGQVWAESRFGSTPDWGTSNNWGACVYHLGDGKFLEHADHDMHGNPVVYRFQAYDTQLEAAKDYLHVLLRGNVPQVLAVGDAHALAAALYANRYYTGVAGSAEDRISAYTSFLLGGAAYVATQLSIAEGGPDVTTIEGQQTALLRLGYSVGDMDGVLGQKTIGAIRAFQFSHPPLAVDGKCGSRTQAAILTELAKLS